MLRETLRLIRRVVYFLAFLKELLSTRRCVRTQRPYVVLHKKISLEHVEIPHFNPRGHNVCSERNNANGASHTSRSLFFGVLEINSEHKTLCSHATFKCGFTQNKTSLEHVQIPHFNPRGQNVCSERNNANGARRACGKASSSKPSNHRAARRPARVQWLTLQVELFSGYRFFRAGSHLRLERAGSTFRG